MTDTSVIAGNEIIASFMEGYKRDMGHDDMIWDHAHYMSPLVCKYPSELEYHSNWSWLMPVVEKINALQVPEDSRGDVTYVVTIEQGYCVISAGGEGIVSEEQAFDSGEPLIATVYLAVVNFLKQHNSQKEVHHG